MNIVAILDLMARHPGTLLSIRPNQAFTLTRGDDAIAWPDGEAPRLSAEQVRRLVYTPVTPQQTYQLDAGGRLRWEFGVKDLGRFVFHAFMVNGLWRLTISNAAAPPPDASFAGHPDLAEAAAKDPADAQVWWTLGTRRIGEEDPQAALEAFERADALRPDDPSILDQRAFLLLAHLSRGAEGLELYRRAVTLPGCTPVVFSHCGLALFAQRRQDPGLVDEARAVIEAGLAKFPSDADLLEAKRLLDTA
ncbi:MAG: hypothetical protein SFW67_37290 [Myxococcaceae bacterium]|nr:hypothetical protein [Myxococcaceae bacterium]